MAGFTDRSLVRRLLGALGRLLAEAGVAAEPLPVEDDGRRRPSRTVVRWRPDNIGINRVTQSVGIIYLYLSFLVPSVKKVTRCHVHQNQTWHLSGGLQGVSHF